MTDDLRERLNRLPTREQFYADKMKWETVARVTEYAYGVVDDAKTMISDRDTKIESLEDMLREWSETDPYEQSPIDGLTTCHSCGARFIEPHKDFCIWERTRKLLGGE